MLAHAQVASLGVEGAFVLIALGGFAVVYRSGLRAAGSRGPDTTQRLAFAAGLVILGVALAGPVERLAHHSFAAHMAQHLLLGLIAPPLLLVGRPLEVISRLGSRSRQRKAARAYGHILRLGRGRAYLAPVALLAYALTWWFWHAPATYTAALTSPVVHALEHATLIVAALALWAPIVRPRRLPAWLGPLLLLGAAVQGGLLATLLTFAQRPWYAGIGYGTLTPLQDQQFGGAMMWVVAGLVYLFGAATGFVRWLRQDEVIHDRLTRRLDSRGSESEHDATPGKVQHVR